MNISQIEAEFYKKFPQETYNSIGECSCIAIKQFYRSKITELLESTKLNELTEKYIHEQIFLESPYDSLSYEEAYKQAVADQETKIKEALI